MLNIIRRSFVLKICCWLIILSLSGAGIFLFLENQIADQRILFFSIYGIFIVLLAIIFYFNFSRPFEEILQEIKCLLTGRKYRKFYSGRIDEIGVIAHFFNEITKSLEKVSGDIEEGKRMLGELEIASKIQKDILPPANPQILGLEVVAKNRPAVELGGDNFDFITVGSNTFIYVGDVTGHGVPAALIMMMVNTLIHTLAELCENAYDMVVKTNKQIKTRIKSTMFMTMLMLRWNHMESKMTFVGAGHEHLLIYRASTGKVEVKQTGGIALGMVPDNSKLIKETEIPFQKDDIIILYTDGLTEGRNMKGEMYTMENLIKAIELYAGQETTEGLVNAIAKDYAHFVEEHIQDDDVTLIAIKCLGTSTESATQTANKTTSWT